MCFQSQAEAEETFCCPDVSGELIPPLRSRTANSLDVERLARGAGGTSRLAVVVVYRPLSTFIDLY